MSELLVRDLKINSAQIFLGPLAAFWLRFSTVCQILRYPLTFRGADKSEA